MVPQTRDLNRPVHLARRDACIERAMDMLFSPSRSAGTQQRLLQIQRIARLIESARKHAILAMRSNRASDEEKMFEKFISLILQNATSAERLIENQAHIESENFSFFSRLIGEEQQQALLSALHCRRSAEDVLMGLSQILRMVHGSYRALQQKNKATLDNGEHDRTRYRQAFDSFYAELEKADKALVSAVDKDPSGTT